jgi:hypothetical protein
VKRRGKIWNEDGRQLAAFQIIEDIQKKEEKTEGASIRDVLSLRQALF